MTYAVDKEPDDKRNGGKDGSGRGDTQQEARKGGGGEAGQEAARGGEENGGSKGDKPGNSDREKDPEAASRERAEQERSQKRGILIRAVVAAIGAALVAVLLIDWNAIRFEGGRAGTIDAELRGNPVQIASRVAGYVTRIGTDDDQPVRRGQLLYEIEPDTYRAQVAQTQAAVHQAQAEVAELDARMRVQQATIATQAARAQATQANSIGAHQELARQGVLRGTEGEVLRDWQRAAASDRNAREAVLARQDQARVAQAQLAILQAQQAQMRAQLAAQQAQLNLAQITLGYTQVTAPEDGFVTARLTFLGGYVTPGQPLLTFVPRGVWAVADYREEQLDGLAVGQAAELHVDAFPRVTLRGHVQSIGPTSQSRQSALGPDRATGNFTKVVQRVPVKITIDPGQPIVERLLPGLSVETRVFTTGSKNVLF